MAAEKVFSSTTEKDFSTDDLLLALPRVILVNQRIYSLRLFPSMESKTDKIEWNAMYRCETNTKFINTTAETPRETLVKCARKLLESKLVAEIKIVENE